MNSALVTEEQVVRPFVDNDVSRSESGSTLDVTNPSTGRHLISIPTGCDADVKRAVASSRKAFDDGRWSEMPASSKKRILHKLADLIAAKAALLDGLDAGEMGKPVSEALFNSDAAADLMRFYAEAVDKIAGDVHGSDRNSLVLQRFVARGVVAAIVPWNFPTYNAVLKVAPALAAGNCVVLKPSELSSRSAMVMAHLAAQAGVPPGVLNVVPGIGDVVGRALALHADVDMVAFTGSTEVGKRMLRYAGESNMKVVLAECGGKSPHILFGDGIDLEAASNSIAHFLLVNQGQICSVGSRLLVQRSIQSDVIDMITRRLKEIEIGDALNPRTTFGPLVSEKQCARVMHYIQSAEAEGAKLCAGGRQVLKETGGFFVEPTVFRDVSPSARIAREEVFGPVLSVIPFSDEGDAIQIANSTIYGLMAYVWSANLSTGMRVAKSVRSSVLINAAPPSGEGAGHAFSCEPARQSGIGTEGGLTGLQSYLRRQLIWFNHN